MKSVFTALVLVLVFTTGFTCSKNTPPATPSEVPAGGPTPPVEVPQNGGPSTEAADGTTGTSTAPTPGH